MMIFIFKSFLNNIITMDESNQKYVEQIIKSSYAELGFNSLQKRNKMMKELLTQRQLPDEGFD